MKTIQMTLDEELIKEIDVEIKKMGTTRSAFTRNALRNFLNYLHNLELEEKHRTGYKNTPAKPNEFDVWEDEHVWTD
ncbi:MAG: ribbon-helix-helix protein, CopG family [Spirochaetales bacterium]|nr:ribbon-helix-helix protein, CopG family [Spirochaetales bacterium]